MLLQSPSKERDTEEAEPESSTKMSQNKRGSAHVDTMVYLKDRKKSKTLNIALKNLTKTKEKTSLLPSLSTTTTSTTGAPLKKRENPQFNAMYQKEMWDMIRIVLDNCQSSNGNFDFKMIDTPFKNIQMHPLMLLAKSGQEFLLKHPTVEKLLALKWRFLPRFIFYANILLFLLFLILYSVFVVKLSHVDINAIGTNSSR